MSRILLRDFNIDYKDIHQNDDIHKNDDDILTIHVFKNYPNYNCNENTYCSICASNERHLFYLKLKCGHIFHKLCLKTWLLSYKNSCPLCREKT